MGSIFGKEENGKKPSDEGITYMGRDVEIKGDIRFEGSGRIDGKVEGKITVKGSVILGEGSVILSDIEGDTVIVGGKVQGKIIAREKIHLLRTSSFTGDLMTPSLLIEEGAHFNGSSKTLPSAPIADAPAFREKDWENLAPATADEYPLPSIYTWKGKKNRVKETLAES